jgi:SRSO17 transposase
MAATVGVTGWRAEFESLLARFGRLFGRSEPRAQAGRYLEGLLSAVKRTNGWQLAEAIGDAQPWRTQRMLSHVRWDEEAARDLCRADVVEHLGGDGDDAVLVVDETGFPKKGRHSAGVARQYSGTAGRIENCQVAVFLAYASRTGHALVARRLYLPEGWAGDAERRRAAKVPDDLRFMTKPALARTMIARALDAGVPCAWVLGDAVYGADRRLRMMLEARGQPYLLGIRGNDKLWSVLDGRVGQPKPEDLAAALPDAAWQRLSAGPGAKGQRLYDWAWLRLFRLQPPPWDHWLLVRRYFVVFGPDDATLAALARVAGRRWIVEECFAVAKQEVGLADSEVRRYRGWHRHATLAMLALARLAALRAGLNAARGAAEPVIGASCPSASLRSAA